MEGTAPLAVSYRPGYRRNPDPRQRRKARLPWPSLSLVSLAGGCGGPQSWGTPAGAEAGAIAELTWVMVSGAAVIWALVVGAMLWAIRSDPDGGRDRSRAARHMVIWGGMVAPTAVVLALLVAGLLLMRDLTARPASLVVDATGEQWWWRIAHRDAGGAPVPTPNELRLPVGETVEFVLTADDVIHSFWVPSLGGKMDMIPGRTNRLRLTPTETGTFRGACAEFCGEAHAQMALPVVVLEPTAYRDWLARQAEPAAAPASDGARQGLDLFLSTGCGACHTIRGTEAAGLVGPDLTHVGSRLSIAAGTLPMDAEAMARWIANPGGIKPGARMPSFGMLPPEEIALIAGYLVGLK